MRIVIACSSPMNACPRPIRGIAAVAIATPCGPSGYPVSGSGPKPLRSHSLQARWSPRSLLSPTPRSPQCPLIANGIESTSHQRQGNGRARGQSAGEPVRHAQRGQAEGEQGEQAERGGHPAPRQPHQQPGDRDDRAEADRGLQPRPALATARRQNRAAKQKRSGADQRRRGVGPDHERANYGSGVGAADGSSHGRPARIGRR